MNFNALFTEADMTHQIICRIQRRLQRKFDPILWEFILRCFIPFEVDVHATHAPMPHLLGNVVEHFGVQSSILRAYACRVKRAKSYRFIYNGRLSKGSATRVQVRAIFEFVWRSIDMLDELLNQSIFRGFTSWQLKNKKIK
jgi:hypothetical protein